MIFLRSFLLLGLLALGAAASAQDTRLVRGRVTESGTGYPVAGALIYLEITDMRIRRQVGFETIEAEPNGLYFFDLGAKYGTVPSYGLQFNVISPLHQQVMKIERPGEADFPLEADFELPEGMSVRGRVLDQDGNAVAGAYIEGSGARRVQSGEDGSFHLMGLGTHTGNVISARRTGFATTRVNLDPAPQSIIEDFEIRLESGFDLKVKVVAPDGRTPVTNGNVTLQAGGRFLQDRPDRQGLVAFASIPVEPVPSLRYTGPRFLFTPRSLTPRDMEAGEVTMVLEPAAFLTGRIFSHEGGVGSVQSLILEDLESDKPIRLVPGAAGVWESGPLPLGKRYNIVALPGGSRPRRGFGELTFLAANPDGTIPGVVDPWNDGFSSRFTATVHADGRVEMIRRDSGPGGFEGSVRYLGRMEDGGNLMTGEVMLPEQRLPGRFTARAYDRPGRLAGTWDLREELPPGRPSGPAMVEVQTPPFPARQRVNLKLVKPSTLSGIATDGKGIAVRRGVARVDSWRNTSAWEASVPVTDGLFLLEGLPSEPVLLSVHDFDTGLYSVPQWVIPKGQQIIVVVGVDDPEDGLDPIDTGGRVAPR